MDKATLAGMSMPLQKKTVVYWLVSVLMLLVIYKRLMPLESGDMQSFLYPWFSAILAGGYAAMAGDYANYSPPYRHGGEPQQESRPDLGLFFPPYSERGCQCRLVGAVRCHLHDIPAGRILGKHQACAVAGSHFLWHCIFIQGAGYLFHALSALPGAEKGIAVAVSAAHSRYLRLHDAAGVAGWSARSRTGIDLRQPGWLLQVACDERAESMGNHREIPFNAVCRGRLAGRGGDGGRLPVFGAQKLAVEI